MNKKCIKYLPKNRFNFDVNKIKQIYLSLSLCIKKAEGHYEVGI